LEFFGRGLVVAEADLAPDGELVVEMAVAQALEPGDFRGDAALRISRSSREAMALATGPEALISNGRLAVAAEGCAWEAAYHKEERLSGERRSPRGAVPSQQPSGCNNHSISIGIEPLRFELGIGFPS